VSAYNLPFALRVCDRLRSSWDRTSCTGGVYMENVNAANGTAYGGTTPWLRADDLVYPCNAPVTRGHRLYCYLMVTSRILASNGYDWRGTARVCSRVSARWVSTCFESYGRDADGFTRQDPKRVRALCAIAGSHARDCVYGAARDMTANYSSGVRAGAFCRIVAGALRPRCFWGVGSVLGTLYADTPGRRRACRAVSGPYLEDCLRGAGVSA